MGWDAVVSMKRVWAGQQGVRGDGGGQEREGCRAWVQGMGAGRGQGMGTEQGRRGTWAWGLDVAEVWVCAGGVGFASWFRSCVWGVGWGWD